MYTYRMLSMSDPDMPDTDEPVDAREALAGPLKDKYLEAIRSEWENLRKKTLVPVSKQELEQYVSNGGDYEKIGLTMKTKMKLKPDGTLDKFKGRGAGRGDQWVRQRIKKRKPLPKTFSPTVKPLTNLRMDPATRHREEALSVNVRRQTRPPQLRLPR